MKALVSVVLLASAACSKSKPNVYEEQLKKHGPALQKRLDTLRVILDAAKKRPALTPPTFKVQTAGDRTFFGLEETTILDQHSYQGQPGCHPVYDGDALSLVAGKGLRSNEPAEDMVRKDFETALEPTHAIVCVQLASVAPKKSGEDTFDGGTYEGECRIFGLEDAAYLGGFAISTSLQRASVNSRNGSGLSEAMESAITNDIELALAPTGAKPPLIACSWPEQK